MICISQVFCGIATYFIVSSNHTGLPTYSSFVVLLPVVAIISAIVGQIWYQKETQNTKDQNIEIQLARFGKACFIIWLSVEIPIILSVTFYFLTADIKFLAAFVGLFFLFLTHFPTESKFKATSK